MNYTINGRKPASVFRYFEEICAIPHPSYHEEQIADYLVTFAKERNLEYYRDQMHNVLIKKPATVGCEDKPAILLQGHTDMVCEKNSDVQHDFSKDALRLFLEGEWLGAEGTTLGADDGIAVAIMLALLDGEIAAHPALECLFTVAEEVGLNGAKEFDCSRLSARKMLNLDSEALGEITAGCAGGLRSDLTLPCKWIPFEGEALSVSVQGLMGGHSGADIHTGRANANKLMGRLLATLSQEMRVHLFSLEGGSKDNAIPRECVARVSVLDSERAKELLEAERARIAGELIAEDGGFSVHTKRIEAPKQMLSWEDSRRAIAVLSCAANGVLEMSRDIDGLVEYSRNLGIVRTEDASLTFVFSCRSSMESRLDASIAELNVLASVTGCKTRHYNRYPGWNYTKESALCQRYQAAYRDVMGEDAKVNVIHAGLECGILYSRLPDLDIISIGPDMRDIHSPDERLNLASVERLWEILERFFALCVQ